jgi:cytochrome b
VAAVRVWDLPTRLFHWLFAAACTAAWLSGDDPRYTDWHLFAGYVALALVLFRLGWGVVGGRYARFAQFVKGPSAVSAHLRQMFDRTRSHDIGHNPLGALAVVLMLALVLLLGITGLVVLGGEEEAGPLVGVFSVELGVRVHAWHEILAWALLGLVVLHLCGVLLESLLQRLNLPRAMLTGMKPARADQAEPRNHAAVAVLLSVVLAAFSFYWARPYWLSGEEQPYLPFVGGELRQSAVWQTSCGECHLAYHPSLLPQRSWQRLLDGQADHFGEDLFLEPETLVVLREYVAANSAEQVVRESSWRTLRSLSAEAQPLRITDTPYWQQVHSGIDEVVWQYAAVNGKSNCAACHRDAERGGFMNGAMRLPN